MYTNFLMNDSTQESGRPYLKAMRKDHILPMMGNPISPGGREYCLSPNERSWIHQFMFLRMNLSTIRPPKIAKANTKGPIFRASREDYSQKSGHLRIVVGLFCCVLPLFILVSTHELVLFMVIHNDIVSFNLTSLQLYD